MKCNKEHLVINPELTAMECLHCGAKQTIPIPVYLDIFIAMMKAWEKGHKHCTKKVPDDSQGLKESEGSDFNDLSDRT